MGKFKTSRYYYWSAICLAIVLPAHSHPKGSKSSSQYDQKQTGDYNIQLHLKDFQIIAMVPDDSFGALGVSTGLPTNPTRAAIRCLSGL